MSDLIVINDATVHELLVGLSKNEILSFQNDIAETLQQYSTSKEREYQPDSSVIVRPNGQKTLFRPFTSSSSVGIKIIVDPAPIPKISASQDQEVSQSTGEYQKLPLGGVLALCDEVGKPTGVINAKEVTGYRTSLSALIPYVWRRRTRKVVVFGAGMQSLWHIRLALALRGNEIESITVVNRSGQRARSMLSQVDEENKKYWKSPFTSTVLENSQPGYDQMLQSTLSDVDIVFCTVPSHEPLFPLSYILGQDKKRSLPLITAIGSWQANMIELDPRILQHVVEIEEGYNPASGKSGVVIVDDREETAHSAGEIIQSGLKSEHIVEIGQVVGWRKESEDGDWARNDRFTSWLEDGFVVYKSVGVSVTDLASGNKILSLAREKSLGTVISNF